jgi:hypothetical protein
VADCKNKLKPSKFIVSKGKMITTGNEQIREILYPNTYVQCGKSEKYDTRQQLDNSPLFLLAAAGI